MEAVRQLRMTIINVLVNPFLKLLMAVTLLVFVWGLVQFLYALSTGGSGIEEGKKHMIWGIIGLVIMTSAYAIINILLGTFGVSMPK